MCCRFHCLSFLEFYETKLSSITRVSNHKGLEICEVGLNSHLGLKLILKMSRHKYMYTHTSYNHTYVSAWKGSKKSLIII